MSINNLKRRLKVIGFLIYLLNLIPINSHFSQPRTMIVPAQQIDRRIMEGGRPLTRNLSKHLAFLIYQRTSFFKTSSS